MGLRQMEKINKDNADLIFFIHVCLSRMDTMQTIYVKRSLVTSVKEILWRLLLKKLKMLIQPAIRLILNKLSRCLIKLLTSTDSECR